MIIAQIFPQCDICHRTFTDLIGASTKTKLREIMRKEGWYCKGGKDICPSCMSVSLYFDNKEKQKW